ATLGALLCVPVMLNVAFMNFCYGVPVKLYSSMMVLSALVLVAFDARRLLDLLVFHRATNAAPPRPPFRSPALNGPRWGGKLAAAGRVIASCFYTMSDQAYGSPHALAGAWEVTSFGRVGLAPGTEAPRWQRLAIGRFGATIRLDTGALANCGVQGEPPQLVLD